MTILVIFISMFVLVILSTVFPPDVLMMIIVPGIIIGLLISINDKLQQILKPNDDEEEEMAEHSPETETKD